MARAKSTARAEARRRHRAEQAMAETTDTAPEAGAAPAPSTQRAGANASAAVAVPQRMSFAAAFRASFRPIDLRGDIRALPSIAIHSKALWLPLLLTLVSTIAFAITLGNDLVTRFMFAYFVQTPAIGGVFIAGFLAPRAAWLLGLIVGLFSAICYSILVTLVFSAILSTANTTGVSTTTSGEIITSALALSPVVGAVFAAAAAWYRRFLQLSNPNRGRQPPPAKRGPDGRSRGGASKASARR